MLHKLFSLSYFAKRTPPIIKHKFCSQFFSNQCEGAKYNQLCPAEGHVLYILIYEYLDMYLIANCFLKEGSFNILIKNGDYISNVHLWQVSLYLNLK